jgi:hypothetical protein
LVGLTERVAALAEALCPLVIAWLVRESDGGGGNPPLEEPAAPPAPEDEQPAVDVRRPRPETARR